MTKFLPLSFLLLTLVSCGGGGGGGGSTPSSTEQTLNPPTGSDNYPQGLENKLITKNEVTHVPMNLVSQNLTMTFDVTAGTVKGHSVINFNTKQSGRPYFELQGTVTNVKIDGVSSDVTNITDPDGQSQTYKSVNEEVSSDDTHVVEFDYTLPTGRVTYTGGGVRFLTDMTDLNGKFFEYWGPTGFEEDQFAMTLNLKVVNGTSSHTLRTNGEIASSESAAWKIEFPKYYSKSSFYVHLTNQSLPSKTLVYKGLEKDIPIEVYGVTQTLVNTAVAQLSDLFKELEADYGPYPHTKFLAYMNDRSGGMEYVAATITSVASIDHELLHSWFARSIIPADGRSGWIDEATASWRDYGYTRATSTLNRTATNLANFSQFRKSTPSNAYVDGRALYAELDKEFASVGGLKKALKALHAEFKHSVINNEMFWLFLESYTAKDLDAFQERYVTGDSAEMVSLKSATISESGASKHPNPLTEEEILRLR